MNRSTQFNLDEKHVDKKSSTTVPENTKTIQSTRKLQPYVNGLAIKDKETDKKNVLEKEVASFVKDPKKVAQFRSKSTQTVKSNVEVKKKGIKRTSVKRKSVQIKKTMSVQTLMDESDRKINKNADSIHSFFLIEQERPIESTTSRAKRLINKRSVYSILYSKSVEEGVEETLEDKYLTDFIIFVNSPQMKVMRNSYLSFMYKKYKSSRKIEFDKLQKEEKEKRKRKARYAKSMKLKRKSKVKKNESKIKGEEEKINSKIQIRSKKKTIRTYRHTGTIGTYRNKLERLQSMGYDLGKCKSALFQANGKLEDAAQIIVK